MWSGWEKEAQAYLVKEKKGVPAEPVPVEQPVPPGPNAQTPVQQSLPGAAPAPAPSRVSGISWSGNVPSQKWMNFYTKVLSRFAATSGLKLTVQVEVIPNDGIAKQTVEDTQNALRELGLDDHVNEK